MRIGYYINDRFTLDDGTPAGVNVMLFGGRFDMSYWFDEYRCETVQEAHDFIMKESVSNEMTPVQLGECPNAG